jgi:PhnB protein
MTEINPYLNFNGSCREAMNFYKECLGGELTLMAVYYYGYRHDRS